MIANLIHPHANMPQDALDDLRVVDQRHDAHLVMTLRTQQRINFPNLLDQLSPRTRRNAPRLERRMLDDFNRCAYFGATPLLCCCCGLARGLLLCLLCTLPALPAHLVGVPAVVTHHLKALIRNVLGDRRDEHLKVALYAKPVLCVVFSLEFNIVLCHIVNPKWYNYKY